MNDTELSPTTPNAITRRGWITSAIAAAAVLAVHRRALAQREAVVPLARDRARLWNREEQPFNAEAYLPDLIRGSVTPVEHFFIRTNGEIPRIAADGYKLRIVSLDRKETTFTLGDLAGKFDTHEVSATLTCAGNRRSEFAATKKVSGLLWGAGAIGHAIWQGVLLRDVLASVGVPSQAKHVWFDSHDRVTHKDGTTGTFGGSLPLERVMNDDYQVLLATHMNGLPLTADHGYPLRLVAPGVIGARSVKWLDAITLAERPSTNTFVDQSYKLVQSDDKAEAAKTDPIYEFSINSVICLPETKTKVPPGKLRVVGYAVPSGSGAVVKEVTIQLGDAKPIEAKLLNEPKPFAWVLWSAWVDVPPGKHRLTVRASDSKGAKQPDVAAWNYRGYQYNAPHQVELVAQ